MSLSHLLQLSTETIFIKSIVPTKNHAKSRKLQAKTQKTFSAFKFVIILIYITCTCMHTGT